MEQSWEKIRQLGAGGQSEVFLVRTPKRTTARNELLDQIRMEFTSQAALQLATSTFLLINPDSPEDLGALKQFRIKPNGRGLTPTPGSEDAEAIQRLENEISILKKGWSGLAKLLDHNVNERWMVTEFYPLGTLEDHIQKFQGRPLPALKAFRTLVTATALLHDQGIVHRDIKPANVFLRQNDELVLGDFGIAYLPPSGERLTDTKERVGPRDYMPSWADLGARLESPEPNFDVYMLGKLLWCMLAGRLKLPREYFLRENFNLVELFPKTPAMYHVNRLLAKTVVEHSHECLRNAQLLLGTVDQTISLIEQTVPPRDGSGSLLLPCRVCGIGHYRPHPATYVLRNAEDGSGAPNVIVRIYVCDVCNNLQHFLPSFPETAFKNRGI